MLGVIRECFWKIGVNPDGVMADGASTTHVIMQFSNQDLKRVHNFEVELPEIAKLHFKKEITVEELQETQRLLNGMAGGYPTINRKSLGGMR
jgi:hypothetical protein